VTRVLRVSVVVTAAVVTGLLLAGAVAATVHRSDAKQPIVVGEAVAKTGVMAYLDQPAHTGTELAIADINKRGGLLGRPLKLVSTDTTSDPNEGAKAADEVLSKGAQLVIVSCDFDFGGPAAREADRKGVVSFSQCGASTKFGPVGIGPLGFTMADAAPVQGAIHAEHAIARGWKKSYILVDTSIDFDNQMCFGFEKRYQQLGGKIVGKDTFTQSDPSIASQITRLQSAKDKPQAIMLCTYQPGLAKALRQIRGAGIKVPVFSGDDGDGTFWHKTVPGIKNFFYTTYGSIFGDDSKVVNQFFKRYRSVSGAAAPTSHSLTGYGIIQAWSRAVAKAGTTDGDKVAQALETFKNVPTILGPTTFSKKWHVQWRRPMALMEVLGPGRDRLVKKWTPKVVPVPQQ
jgi:branched-chain amino acid transport system substrate-binding protein